MNKKASTIGELLGWIIAIAVFVLIVSIFFIGPQAFFMKIKGIIPSANILQNKGTGTTADYDTRSDTEQAIDMFRELTTGFAELADDDALYCFYYLPEDFDYETLFDEQLILAQNIKDGTAFYLRKDINTDGEAISDTAQHVVISNMNLCLVYEESNVNNFYESWLSNEIQAQEPEKDYADQNELTLKKNRIFIGDKSLNWDVNKDGNYIIYKHYDGKKNHICLIPNADGWPGCNVRDNLLDDDCFTDDKDALTNMLREYHSNHAYEWTEKTGNCEPVTKEETS